MAGRQPERQAVALVTALAVATDPLAIRDRTTRPEIKVRAAERREQLDKERGVVRVVLEPVHPQGLVVADDRGHVLGQDPALACCDHQLAVRDVADAFEDGPFARLGPDAEEVAGVGHERAQRVGRACLDRGRVVVAERRQQ